MPAVTASDPFPRKEEGGRRKTPHRLAAVVCLLCAVAGVALVVATFHPGLLNVDAFVQLNEARAQVYFDWHPPLMSRVWSVLDRISPGPVGMLLLDNVLFWSGLALAVYLANLPPLAAAAAIFAIGLSPPVFSALGVIWKDVAMGAALDRLLATGGRLYPTQQVLLHDLAAISVARGRTYLPTSLKTENGPPTVKELACLYTPDSASALFSANLGACALNIVKIVDPVRMADLEVEWMRTVLGHPGAYLAHRWSVFRAQLALGRERVCYPLHVGFDPNSLGLVFSGTPLYRPALRLLGAAAYRTPLFRGWIYLVLAGLMLLAYGRGRRDAAVRVLSASGLLYGLAYLVVSTGCDFRFNWWSIVAALTSVVVAVGGGTATRGAAAVRFERSQPVAIRVSRWHAKGMRTRNFFAGVLALLLPTLVAADGPCSCDCNGDRSVRIHEIATAVNIALDRLSLDRCRASDADGDGAVGVAELVGGVDAGLGACPADPTPTPAPGDALLLLRENRQRWESIAPLRYVYRLQRLCFCLPPSAVDVQVVGGSVVAVLDTATGEPVSPAVASWFPSIAETFDLIESELTAGGRGTLRVVYDPFWGIPIEVDIDFEVAAVDDELSLRVSNLRPEKDGACRTSTDCAAHGGLCVEPGGFVGCGICLDIPDECATDGDCEGEAICRSLGREACSSCDGMPILTCQPGCSSDADCETGSACGENHHCAPVRCRGDEACPSLFACLLPPDSRTGECRRRACDGDQDCGDGYCVNRACYEELGRCELPPP